MPLEKNNSTKAFDEDNLRPTPLALDAEFWSNPYHHYGATDAQSKF